MKLPTSTKPTSGFHICDILELNKDKKPMKKQENHKIIDAEVEMKRENLNGENDEISSKRKHSPSPTSPMRDQPSPLESSRDVKDLKRLKKHLRHDEERSTIEGGHHQQQLLNETLHQYPHLFQNHPAMRPWFNSNGKHRKLN